MGGAKTGSDVGAKTGADASDELDKTLAPSPPEEDVATTTPTTPPTAMRINPRTNRIDQHLLEVGIPQMFGLTSTASATNCFVRCCSSVASTFCRSLSSTSACQRSAT
jgi:hypothetical protein